MDSGAYSAETKGVKITLEDYVKFVKANREYIDVFACLDVLFNPEASWANQMAMEAMNVTPLPTFHFGEDFKWLIRYVEKYDYIALGGQVGQSPQSLMAWLDEVWGEYLTNAQGQPIIRVHGFGVTSVPVMKRYPWFSVDSTSWLMAASMGKIMLHVDGDFVTMAVSETSPFKDVRGQHMDTLPPSLQVGFNKLLTDAGFDAKEVATSYHVREIVNAIAFMQLAETIKYKSFINPRMMLFGEPTFPSRKAYPAWDHLTMYLAGNPAKGITKTLMEKGFNRLMSYHYIDQGQMWEEAKAVLRYWPLPGVVGK